MSAMCTSSSVNLNSPPGTPKILRALGALTHSLECIMVRVDLENGLSQVKTYFRKVKRDATLKKKRCDLCFSILTLQMISCMQAARGEGEVSC